MCHSIPYKKMPKVMVIGLIKSATKWLNAFPSKNGISDTLSPANITQGLPNPNLNHKRIVFGSYAMVFIGSTNTMKRRSVPAIAINSSN